MKILIVEDNKQIAYSLKKHFSEENHNATTCYSAESANEMLLESKFDAIVLDWRLPKLSGIDLCKKLRREGNTTPVVLLTAITDLSNKIEALNSGADDYLTKPFSFEELMARLNAVIRRSKSAGDLISMNQYSLNQNERNFLFNGNKLKLPEKEYELLRYLMLNHSEIISRDILLKEVWKLNFSPGTNLVESTIKNLRRKLEVFTGKNLIKSVYGEGYTFIDD